MLSLFIENNPNASVNEKPNIDVFLDIPVNDKNIVPISYHFSYN